MAEIKETIPFSFDEIYEGIAELFEQKGYDSPYDGSNLSQLITSMAYTTSMLNANTAVNINETILSLAQKRENIVQDARLLGYEATQKISFIYEIEIVFETTNLYNIPHLSKFTDGGNTYYYMGDDIDYDAQAGDSIKILVKEGTLTTYQEEPENLRQVIGGDQFLDIPYQDVESDGIEVYVTYYLDTGILSTKQRFFKSPTLLIDVDDNLAKKFVRLENIEMNTPRIHFTLSDVGNIVPTGAVVEMNVLQSKATEGEMFDIPTTELTNLYVKNYTLSVRGNEIESDQSIKDNAPVLHNTASRCVTANDYEVISKKHSACKEAFVFGGEDEHPKKLGNIFLSLTPEKADRNFIQNDTNTLWNLDGLDIYSNKYLLPNELTSVEVDVDGNIKNPGVLDDIQALNLPALDYNIRNPLYILMDFDINVVKYTLSSVHTEVRQQIFDILNIYILELEKYDTEFFKSNTIKKIDDYLTDITGLDLEVSFKIRLDEGSISVESTLVAENDNIIEVDETAIHLYLDTPYEGIYNNDNTLNTNNLPNIDTLGFITVTEADGTNTPIKDLYVDFEEPVLYPPYLGQNPIPTKGSQSITYAIYLQEPVGSINEPVGEVISGVVPPRDLIGTYTIYNDRTTYIKVKLYPIDIDSASGIVDLPNPLMLSLKYPSDNLKSLRSAIFKLNEVRIDNPKEDVII